MFQLFETIKSMSWSSIIDNLLSVKTVIHLLDILVVWYFIYKLLRLLNGTKAIQVFKGIAIIIIIRIVSDWIGLNTVSWLMSQVITYGAIAAIVIFQPEVRRGLEHLGRGGLLRSPLREVDYKSKLIDDLDEAIQYMSKRKIGALISIEQETSLNEYIETGISLDSDISNQLLINIFIPNTPLHDGAVIIQGEKVASACSYLPLSESMRIPKEFGTRHRAAIGLSEVTDAMTIVVSEETGDVSLTYRNHFKPHLEREEYLRILREELVKNEDDKSKRNGFYQFIESLTQTKGGKK
ncbi:diadenylate cyclase CdaA [Vagococcus vulneris]|uniref:Diadenylate cyclase n=1 Tax=Vagococcus vulneris TaxID=1977869 RepID=A0A429ZZR0_9ENTE|nr:diadenylate cyclase CdaA [Vagococcus vulneris]RST99507.1 TIGR00159 family protein [Vagococcus vulneris]